MAISLKKVGTTGPKSSSSSEDHSSVPQTCFLGTTRMVSVVASEDSRVGVKGGEEVLEDFLRAGAVG